MLEKLTTFKGCKNGRSVLNIFHERDQLSSEGVDSFLTGILSDQDRNMLTDDQKMILASIIKKSQSDEDALFLIDGAPGIGKTMLAIAAIMEMIKNGKKVAYLSLMKVQCDMLREKIAARTDSDIEIEVIPRFVMNQKKNISYMIRYLLMRHKHLFQR